MARSPRPAAFPVCFGCIGAGRRGLRPPYHSDQTLGRLLGKRVIPRQTPFSLQDKTSFTDAPEDAKGFAEDAEVGFNKSCRVVKVFVLI